MVLQQLKAISGVDTVVNPTLLTSTVSESEWTRVDTEHRVRTQSHAVSGSWSYEAMFMQRFLKPKANMRKEKDDIFDSHRWSAQFPSFFVCLPTWKWTFSQSLENI